MHKITEFLRESVNSQGKQTDLRQSGCTGNTTKMKTKKELWARILIRHFEVVCDWFSHKMGLFWRMNTMFILLLAHKRSTSIPIQSRLQNSRFFSQNQ